MKKLLSILLLFVSFGALAQTYDTLPTGSRPYGNFYLGPDGNLVFGNVGLKYRVIGTKKRVDSLLALKAPVSGSANYIQNNNTGTSQSASFNINGVGRFDSPTSTTLISPGLGTFATEAGVTSVNGGNVNVGTELLVPDLAITDSTKKAANTKFVKQLIKAIPPPNLTPYQLRSEKGANGGYPSLDVNGKVPLSQISEALLGSINYKGSYDIAANSPALPAAAPSNKGWLYVVIDSGIYSGKKYYKGDWYTSNGLIWEVLNQTNKVGSVNGMTGAVTVTDITGNAGSATNWSAYDGNLVSDPTYFMGFSPTTSKFGIVNIGQTKSSLGVDNGGYLNNKTDWDRYDFAETSSAANMVYGLGFDVSVNKWRPTPYGTFQQFLRINDGSYLNNAVEAANYATNWGGRAADLNTVNNTFDYFLTRSPDGTTRLSDKVGVKNNLGINDGSVLNNNVTKWNGVENDFSDFGTTLSQFVGVDGSSDFKVRPFSNAQAKASLGINDGSTLNNNISGNWRGNSYVNSELATPYYLMGYDLANTTWKPTTATGVKSWLATSFQDVTSAGNRTNQRVATGGYDFSSDFGANHNITFATGNATKGINMGYNAADEYGFIGVVENNLAWRDLVLQPLAGNLGIGKKPTVALDVKGDTKASGNGDFGSDDYNILIQGNSSNSAVFLNKGVAGTKWAVGSNVGFLTPDQDRSFNINYNNNSDWLNLFKVYADGYVKATNTIEATGFSFLDRSDNTKEWSIYADGDLMKIKTRLGVAPVSITSTGDIYTSGKLGAIALSGAADQPIVTDGNGFMKIGTIPSQVQNNLTASTTKAPSVDAVNTEFSNYARIGGNVRNSRMTLGTISGAQDLVFVRGNFEAIQISDKIKFNSPILAAYYEGAQDFTSAAPTTTTLAVKDGSFTNTLRATSLTANKTTYLPPSGGTLISANDVSTGYYPSTVTAVSNCTLSSGNNWFYTKVNGTVTVSGAQQITITSGSTSSTFKMTLPPGLQTIAGGALYGQGSIEMDGYSPGVTVRKNSSDNTALVKVNGLSSVGDGATVMVFYSFTYSIN